MRGNHLRMKALEQGVGKKYGLDIRCEQTRADGSPTCVWKVRKR